MDKIRNMSKESRSNFITYGMVIVAFLIMQALSSMHAISSSMTGLLVPITAYICMAISLNLVVGVSGELSLGHAGFMSVGAFTGVVAAAALAGVVESTMLRLLLSIIIAGAAAALAGILIGIPVMRLRGDYLAIVTLAFGEIIKNLLNNLYVGLDARGVNGPQGAVGFPMISTFTAGFLLVMFTLFVVQNLINSRSGRAIMAVRDNRIAAESVGIDTTKYRLMAFVVSAALAGMAGALYAQNYTAIVPKKFDFNTSILILVFVVLGGMGNIRGGIISAALLTILPEKLRFIGDYRMLMYAIVLILVMLFSNNAQVRMRVETLRDRITRRVDDRLGEQDAKGGDAR